MGRTDVASARQSQLVTTYGIGALYPASEQSFMLCGTDLWNESRAGVVEEPRLARSLGVHSFRLPPAGGTHGDVPVTRFPLMHYCPGCRRLGTPREFGAGLDKMVCDRDLRDLTPSRFVACCEAGHIEDFPYFKWVHAGNDPDDRDHHMFLETRGKSSSLADIVIRCSCGARPVTMAGSFQKGALVGIARCRGKRPWLLGSEDELCEEPLRVLQRGSANVWFSMMRSTISIPPWSGDAAKLVEKHWDVFKLMDGPALSAVVSAMVASDVSISAETVLDLVARRKGLDSGSAPTERELRQEEYDALRDGSDGHGAFDDFVVESREVDESIGQIVAQVSEVSRLREVRALEGFTRVTPPSSADDPRKGALSESPLGWLPAVEVLGEGVFVRFHEAVVRGWEQSSVAIERERLIWAAQQARDRAMDVPPSSPVTARFLAIHTLAHALVKELSLDAGYPVASLRERVFAEPGQAGVLVYTASSDAAGSLGGLAALAQEDRFGKILRAAAARASWCSSDPVCSESMSSGADSLNLAACHSCVLLPETSCEHRNLYLDRVGMIGRFDDPAVGFAADLLGQAARPLARTKPAEEIPAGWDQLWPDLSPEERDFARDWVEFAGGSASVPTVGADGPEGIPLALAWPFARVAVSSGLNPEEIKLLENAGWRIVAATAVDVAVALAR